MPLDVNGIWQYEETETVAPFSEFMNRLASSTSDQIDSLRNGTAWVQLTLQNGWTPLEGTPAVRRIGEAVWMKGSVTGGTAQQIAQLPAQFIPSEIRRFWVYSSGAADGTVLTVNSNGTLQSAGTRPNTSLSEAHYVV